MGVLVAQAGRFVRAGRLLTRVTIPEPEANGRSEDTVNTVIGSVQTDLTRRRALTLVASGATALASFPALVRAERASVRIAASPAATQAEAYYAEQLGIFKQAGISTTLSTASRGAETLAGIARGDIDVAHATPQGIANAVIHNIPLKIFAAGAIYVEPAAVGLYVTKDSPMKGAADLVNATIAVNSLNDSQSLGVWAWMSDNHVDPTTVKIIEIPFSSMAAALKRKTVVACCLVEPYATEAKDDIRVVPGVYASLGHHWALGVWYARADYVRNNSTLIKQLTAALYTTGKRVNANAASVEQLLVTHSKLELATVRSIIKPVWAEKWERSNIEPQLQMAAKFKLISRPVPYEEVAAV